MHADVTGILLGGGAEQPHKTFNLMLLSGRLLDTLQLLNMGLGVSICLHWYRILGYV